MKKCVIWKCKPYTKEYETEYFVLALKHEISDEEKEMMDGTHEVFEKPKEG